VPRKGFNYFKQQLLSLFSMYSQVGFPDVNGTGIWQFSAFQMMEGLIKRAERQAIFQLT
jgi:hypothetical protein